MLTKEKTRQALAPNTNLFGTFFKGLLFVCMDKTSAEKLYDSGKEATVRKILELDSKVDQLIEQVAKLTKNSSNSSKPPSSDITKPNRAERRREQKRKKGGQPNHPRWEHPSFASGEAEGIDYHMEQCPKCNGPVFLRPNEPPRIVQQIEQKPATEKFEHRAYAYWCPHCKSMHYAAIPDSILNEGLFKVHLSTTVCFLKYVGCMSYSAIKKYLLDAMDIKVSKGYLSKVVAKGAKSLQCPYEELLRLLPHEQTANVDETGHKENGSKFWTWVFRTSLYALFKIDQSRSSQVLIDVLGEEFNGVLGCDYFSAYHKYMRVFDIRLQFCLAHLIRDVKYLTEYPDPAVQKYGNRILGSIRELFHLIHQKDNLSPAEFAKELTAKKEEILAVVSINVPAAKVAQNMKVRFEKHGDSYFTFITTPGMDPTNNCAEQAIRFVVQYRHVSQGTRSENGRIACERFWTVIATCSMQSRSAFDFIKQSLQSFVNGTKPPSLIPASSSP